MPDFDFKVTGVEAANRGIAPLLHFKLEIANHPETEKIHTVILQTQIQIEAPRRSYNDAEKEKLGELFGTPDRWGQTLRNRLWGISNTNVRGFSGSTETVLPMPCTFDLNVAATKYFHALEGGAIPLLFLFSGTVFYEAADGRLQVQQISWNKECHFQMPSETWREMMDRHFPNSAWLYLHRGVFDQLYAFKRKHGFSSWEETISGLLNAEEKVEVPA
ncbi:MAG TPA: DUF6084 family protein [Verrucomicrobiae bacterium]|jgi:hypothetical protein|nr:DUF6084 family protein [Verrucomicrobiae bacterium]